MTLTFDDIKDAQAHGYNVTVIINGEYYELENESTPVIETYETWRGWDVRKFENGRWHYVSKVYNGNYSFVTDHTYAKKFSEKSAKKHAEILRQAAA